MDIEAVWAHVLLMALVVGGRVTAVQGGGSVCGIQRQSDQGRRRGE